MYQTLRFGTLKQVSRGKKVNPKNSMQICSWLTIPSSQTLTREFHTNCDIQTGAYVTREGKM